jgi:hypothetical protein
MATPYCACLSYSILLEGPLVLVVEQVDCCSCSSVCSSIMARALPISCSKKSVCPMTNDVPCGRAGRTPAAACVSYNVVIGFVVVEVQEGMLGFLVDDPIACLISALLEMTVSLV